MAEPTTFKFDLREVTTALIRQQGVTTGKWMVSVEFSLGAGVIGPTPAESLPSAVVQIKNVQLMQPPAGSEKTFEHLIVDATAI